MPNNSNSKGLGASFGSLLPDNFDQSILIDEKDRVQKISLADLEADKGQPRKHFDEQKIDELASSIKRHGLLQPIVVSPINSGKYKIIAGERRTRAAKKAGLKSISAIVRTSEELEHIEIGLVENVQRVDLSPIEQALSIVKLHEQFDISYRDIAKKLGKAEPTVVNIARLLQLPKNARQALEESKISEGHARSILALKGSSQAQNDLLNKIIKNKISVRQAEQYVTNAKAAKTPQQQNKSIKTEVDKGLTQKLGSKVTIKRNSQGGKIEIEFSSEEKLKKILEKLS